MFYSWTAPVATVIEEVQNFDGATKRKFNSKTDGLLKDYIGGNTRLVRITFVTYYSKSTIRTQLTPPQMEK